MILDTLASKVGAHCRIAQRAIGQLDGIVISPDVKQVFAIADCLFSHIGSCMMQGLVASSAEPMAPLLVPISLYERVEAQARSLAIHRNDVNEFWHPVHFAATALECNRSVRTHAQYMHDKATHADAAL